VTSARMKGLAVAAVSLLTLGAGAPTTQPARRALSGDLTKPLAQYTGAQFAALVAPLRYGQGAARQRRCRGPLECTNGKQVSVRVDAVADADSLAAGNLATNGVIAARLRNRGGEMEARYNMRGGAQYSYYLIVQPATGGRANWILEELDTQGTTVTHRTVASGNFVGCNHPFRRGARADFYTCATSPATGRTSLQPVSFERQGGPGDPPIWIGCAAGCCIAET
jgi:hypothetical protein